MPNLQLRRDLNLDHRDKTRLLWPPCKVQFCKTTLSKYWRSNRKQRFLRKMTKNRELFFPGNRQLKKNRMVRLSGTDCSILLASNARRGPNKLFFLSRKKIVLLQNLGPANFFRQTFFQEKKTCYFSSHSWSFLLTLLYLSKALKVGCRQHTQSFWSMSASAKLQSLVLTRNSHNEAAKADCFAKKKTFWTQNCFSKQIGNLSSKIL